MFGAWSGWRLSSNKSSDMLAQAVVHPSDALCIISVAIHARHVPQGGACGTAWLALYVPQCALTCILVVADIWANGALPKAPTVAYAA